MARSVPKTLEVYEPGRDYKDAPNEVVPYDEGLRRVDAGEASWCKHNRGIRMHRPRPSLRGHSCNPNDKLMQRYVEARDPALRSALETPAFLAIEAWRGAR